jgi:hypothetical protein
LVLIGLETHLLNDFTSSLGTTFDGLTASGVTGQFRNILLQVWAGMTFQADFRPDPMAGLCS